MDISWLRTFVIAAQEANFGRTAERLHLAQPTVSVQIHKLEEELGVKLFDRVGRNIVLNDAGRSFLVYARQVVLAYDEGLDYMARWRQGYESSLRIATSPIIATTVLPVWVQKYELLSPTTEFQIEVMESIQIGQCVRERTVDLGLSRIPIVDTSIECIQLYRDPVVMVGPKSPYDLDGPISDAEDSLLSRTLYTYNHPLYWDEIMPLLRRRWPNIRTMRVSQVYVTLEWISQGMGVSFLPESTAQQQLLRGRIEEIPFPWFELPSAYTYLLMPKAAGRVVCEFANHLLSQTG